MNGKSVAATASISRPRMVDSVRHAARLLVSTGTQDAASTALDVVRHAALQAATSSPAGPDLREWQHLALDLEAALAAGSPELAQAAEDLAAELRSFVTTAARNPADQLAGRPASRRVLLALQELGDGAKLSRVRERTRHSAPHLSNILKALTVHGFVRMTTDDKDGRGKRLSLTDAGRQAIQQEAGRGKILRYRDNISNEDTRSTEVFRRTIRSNARELELAS